MPLYNTGFSQLPDVGTLAYNGCRFSSLFATRLSWKLTPDNAGRTIKWAEATLTARGVATADLPGFPLASSPNLDPTMSAVRNRLSQYGGRLQFTGKGFGPFDINPPELVQVEGVTRDLAWGPKTELIDFQPLGGSRSALVEWRVTTCVPASFFAVTQPAALAVVQFNEEVAVTYDQDSYAELSVRGTLEIPLTRNSVNDRTVSDTVDSFRRRFLDFDFDLTRYRVVRRNFATSRDKRTSEWEYQLGELPPMGLPPFCSTARGRFAVRPARPSHVTTGVSWNASLRGTYAVAKGQPRRLAYDAFLSLLQYRMMASAKGFVPDPGKNDPAGQQPARPGFLSGLWELPPNPAKVNVKDPLEVYRFLLADQTARTRGKLDRRQVKAWLFYFAFDEGLYLDSREVSFEASWRLVTTIDHLLEATGLWTWEPNLVGGKGWALSVRDRSGWKGNLNANENVFEDIIVDVGL